MDLRRAPPSSPHLLPRKRQRGRCHTLWPPARSPTASAPSPSPPGRPAPPGCRLAERIYLHISTFVPCRRPISARGEAAGGGPGRGSGSGSSCGSRRFQSGFESRRARSALQPQPRAPHRGFGQAPEARTKRLSRRLRPSHVYLRLREPQAPRWFAGASRVPRTACVR